jgi:hypothetical protein
MSVNAFTRLFSGSDTLAAAKKAFDTAQTLYNNANNAAKANPGDSGLQNKLKSAQSALDTAKSAYNSLKSLSGSSTSPSSPSLMSGVPFLSSFFSSGTTTTPRATTPILPPPTWLTPSVKVVIGLAIALIIYVVLGFTGLLPSSIFPWYISKPDAISTTANLNGKAKSLTTKEGFQATPPQSITPAETLFVNLQPLCIKDTGFKGPYPNGEYDVSNMTANALKAGFRCLTLNIDYMDTNKKGFEAPNEPTLIVRDTNGGLLSSNSGSIEDVCKVIADMGFNGVVPNSEYPIILYLHINRAPSAISKPEKYLAFLSAIATQLNPIAPLHLGLSSLGNFTRQKQEEVLLRTPIEVLEGNVIVLCNADTSMFTSSSNATPYPPSQDLDFWVNMRVYLDSDSDTFGITKLPPKDTTPAAVIVDLNRILALNGVKQEQFAANGMHRYVIGMGDRLTNPSPAVVDTALNTLGVNCIPIDIFSDNNIMNLTKEYDNMTYHPKPSVLRKAD